QSPDDTGATFRAKRGEDYQGYVTNVTETCDPDNDIQLIVKVQTASNTADDAQMLNHAVPNLVARTDVNEIYTDGGYNSPITDKILQEYHIEQYQTAIRGVSPRDEDNDPLRYSDFVFERTQRGFPLKVQCPHGQLATVETTYTEGRFRAAFDAEVCAACPLLDRCPTFPLKRRPDRRHLRFGQQDVNIAHRHANLRKAHASEHNLRSAVEATVRSLKHPFGNDKLPVRGHTRMSMMMVMGAAMVNIRRIWRRMTTSWPATPAAVALATHRSVTPLQVFVPSRRFLPSLA
ncbi:MAG: transposase, partial [Pseudomonadota bacterium]